MKKSIRVWTTSLGCPKNRVDTERLLGSLGYAVRPAKSPGAAQLALINTCAFIEPACRESLREIFDLAAKIKNLKHKPLLAVAGCLPGRYGIETLAKEIPEVDLWLESASITDWPAKLRAALGLEQKTAEGRLITGETSVWLKISEGCQRKCAFCAIPQIRGPLKSLPADKILAEARHLLANGAMEISLVGQDVTAWGRDLSERQDLPDLIQKLRDLDGLRWLRLLYLYPDSISEKLLSVIADGAPVLPYLDIPLQHCQPGILAAMGRAQKENPADLLLRIRKKLPNAALRTTLIAGYPGETEADFNALCQFVKDARFQNLGVFTFMPEEGTKAAQLPNQIPESIKAERAETLMQIQAQISREILAEFRGQRMEVLVDKACENEWPGLHAGRVWFQAPEVDGVTYISGEGVAPGKIINAEIADSQTYDLSALA